MLGKQRNNQANDPQFMETAWENMAEILDREMPVEQKERRIGWMSIAALVVMGFVGGISAMWGLQKHHSAPMAVNQAEDLPHHTRTTNPDADLQIESAVTYSDYEENPALTNNNPIAHNYKNTANQKITTSTLRETRTSHPVNSSNTIPATIPADQNGLFQNAGDLKTSARLAMAVHTPEKTAQTSAPLFALPVPDMAALTAGPSGFTIDNDLDLPKSKKWKTGVYGGVVIAGKKGNGLEIAFRAERRLGAKWAVETGLGLRATQLAFLSENEDSDELAFARDFQSSIEPAAELSYAERRVLANTVNAEAPDYHLTVPLSVVYRPTGKLRLAMGMSWAYRLNALKDASSFSNSSNAGNEILSDASNKNSFSERFNDFRMNLGVGYQLNDRMAIELGYSKQFKTKNNNNTNNANASTFPFADDATVLGEFFRLGWIYNFRG